MTMSKPKKPPDPSQPPSPNSFLILFHSSPLSLHSPSLNLANYASCAAQFPFTQPYTRLCPFGCLSSVPIITIRSASLDEKMAKLSALASIPYSLIPPVSLSLKLSAGASILVTVYRLDPSAGHLRRLEPRSAIGAIWCIVWHDVSGRGMGIGIALCFIKAFRGPGSGRFVCLWQFGMAAYSVSMFFSLLFFRLTQVSAPLPLLLLTILMVFLRAYFSIVWRCLLFECCVCWIGLPRLAWLWISLWLLGLGGIELLELDVIWGSCMFCGTGLLCHLLLRILAHPMDSILDNLGHLLPCFTKIGGCNSSGYNCFCVVCSMILFSTIWRVVWGWVPGFFDKGYDACHCGEWIGPHRVYTLLPDRGSISWYCAQSVRLSNHGPLDGNLWLLCSLSLDLRTSNPIWPVCGQCLFCYLHLGLHLWLVWFVTQHCYMPGMCLMALVLQRRLLELWLPWWFIVLFRAVFTAPVHAVSFSLFPPWYVVSDWELVLWMLKVYLLPSLCSAGCPLYYLVVNVQLISYPLCICAARVYLFHPYCSNLLSCVLSFLLVYSSCLPSRCLRNLPQKGDQQIHNLMLTHVLNSVIGVGFFFFWVLPLDLLSLCLCFLYAQMHVPAHVNSCWQLNTLQTTRDEVTGFYPFAYEDLNTEANLFMSWELIFHYSVLSALFWILSVLQMRWMELHLFWAPSITFGLLLTLPQTQSTPVLRAQLSLISYTDFGLIWIVLYWSSGFWPVVSNCNYSFTRLVSLLWVFVCIDKKLSPCSSFAVKIVEPHCCASGLCIKALAWHRQMPVTTHKGLGQKNFNQVATR